MFVNEKNKRKIIACLEAGNLVKDIKEKTRCTIYEINSVIKELGDEFSSNYNLELYEKVTARETAYEEEKEKAKERAITFLEQNVKLEEVAEKTNLNRDEIRNALKKLRKSGPEGEARYQKIQDNFKKQQEEKEVLDRKMDEEILALWLDKVSIKQIMNQKHISKSQMDRVLNKFEKENPDIYLKTMEERKLVANEKAKANADANRIFFSTESVNIYIAKLMLENDFFLEHTAFLMKIAPTKLYDILLKITDEQIKAKLQPILELFKKQWMNKTDKPKKSVKDYPPSIQKDIILTALTYRIPIELMPNLFNTTIDDIYELYISFDEYREVLIYVNKETRYESEEIRSKNYTQAAEYWQVYNNLAKLSNITKEQKRDLQKKLRTHKEENILEQITMKNQKIKEITERLKEHHTLIGNEIIATIISKKFSSLTIEEREYVARYRLKYCLSRRTCAKIFQFNVRSIEICEEELAQTDKIYAEKINFLNSLNFNQYRAALYHENRERLSVDINENFNQTINSNYFQQSTNSAFYEDTASEAKSTWGGGY